MSDSLSTQRDPDDLERLISAYHDGSIDDDQHATLCELLRSDPENARIFARMSVIHRRLSELMSREQDNLFAILDLHEIQTAELLDALDDKSQTPQLVDITEQVVEKQLKQQEALRITNDAEQTPEARRVVIVIPKAVAYLAVAAVIALLVCVNLYFFSNKQTPPANTQVGVQAETKPASLVDQDDAVWGDGQSLVSGAGLSADQSLSLLSGVVEVAFIKGAVVTLEGPCQFQIIDDNTISLQSGRLVALAGGTANYFSVRTPTAEVVDFGTEFGVHVNDHAATQVAVFDGLVSLQSSRDQRQSGYEREQPLMISEGRKVDLSKDGVVSAHASALTEADKFAYARSLDVYRSTEFQYQRAIMHSSPIAYWRFESGDTKRVRNEVAPGTNDLLAVGRVEIVEEGAFGNAASCSTPEAPLGYFIADGELVFDPGADGYTIECLFSSNREQYAAIISLFDDSVLHDNRPFGNYATLGLTDDNRESHRSIPGWQASSLRGMHRSLLRSSQGYFGANVFGGQQTPLNQWQHAAFVATPQSISLYLNGQLVGQSRDAIRIKTVLQAVVGMSASMEPEGGLVANSPFTGMIDEVAIYSRALDSLEIARHHEIWSQQQVHKP